MTILVTLALAKNPIQCADLWRHIKRRNFGCVRDLCRRGLIARWKVGRATFVSLEPSHPAAASLKVLLLRTARRYGFIAPVEQCSMIRTIRVPARRAKIDARFTFGDKNRTLPLLIVAIRGKANAEQVARCIPRSDMKTVRHILLMFKAFGVLKSCRVSRGIAFELDPFHELASEIKKVLLDLDRAMPQWRVVAENDMQDPRPRSRENRRGRRKPSRWRW
jgi:hypothetical protein